MKRFCFIAAIFLLLNGSLFAQIPVEIRWLEYTETKGWNHNTKKQSGDMLDLIAAEESNADTVYIVIHDDDGSEFDDLSSYSTVILANCTGSSGLTATQRANFEAFMLAGGNSVGIHGASDFYRHSSANGGSTGDWDWYAENVSGASVQQSPNHTSSNHVDTIFFQTGPYTFAMQPFAGDSIWIKKEEYYYWENGYLNTTDFVEVARVGETGGNSYDAPRMIAQYRQTGGGGCTFYTALGHDKLNYTQDTLFKRLIRNALMNPCGTSFGIRQQIPEPKPEIISGVFQLEKETYSQTYQVTDILGRVVHVGMIEFGQIPIYHLPGIWNYKAAPYFFVHGTTE